MGTKTFLAALAGAVVFFLTGWLVYGVLLMDFYTANTTHYEGLMNEMPNLIFLFISHFVLALLFAFIFERWANISTFKSGFTAGLILGFLIFLSVDFYFLAAMNLMTVLALAVDVVTVTLMSGLMGGVVALVLGTKKATA